MNCECNNLNNINNIINCVNCNRKCHFECYGRNKDLSLINDFYCYNCKISILNPFYHEKINIINKMPFKNSSYNLKIFKKDLVASNHFSIFIFYENKVLNKFNENYEEFYNKIYLNNKVINLNELLFYNGKIKEFIKNKGPIIEFNLEIKKVDIKNYCLFFGFGNILDFNNSFINTIINFCNKINYLQYIKNREISINLSLLSKNHKNIITFVSRSCIHLNPLNLKYYLKINFNICNWRCYICEERILLTDILLLKDLNLYLQKNMNWVLNSDFRYLTIRNNMINFEIEIIDIDNNNSNTIEQLIFIKSNSSNVNTVSNLSSTNIFNSINYENNWFRKNVNFSIKNQIIKKPLNIELDEKYLINNDIENNKQIEEYIKNYFKIINGNLPYNLDYKDLNLKELFYSIDIKNIFRTDLNLNSLKIIDFFKNISNIIKLKLKFFSLEIIEGFLIYIIIFDILKMNNIYEFIEYYILNSINYKLFISKLLLGFLIAKENNYRLLNFLNLNNDKLWYIIKIYLIDIKFITNKFKNNLLIFKNIMLNISE